MKIIKHNKPDHLQTSCDRCKKSFSVGSSGNISFDVNSSEFGNNVTLCRSCLIKFHRFLRGEFVGELIE